MGACSSCCGDRSTTVEGGDDAYTRMRWAAGSLDKQSILRFMWFGTCWCCAAGHLDRQVLRILRQGSEQRTRHAL